MKNTYTTMRRILLGATVVVIIGIGTTAFMYTRTTASADNVILEALNQRIEYVSGIHINNIDMSGKTIEEATALMQQQKPPRLKQVLIKNGDKSEVLDLSALVPIMNVDEVLQEAFDYGNGADPQLRETQRRQAASQGMDFQTKNSYDIEPLRVRIEAIAQALDVDPVDAQVKVIGKENAEAKETTQQDATDAIDSIDASAEEDEVAEVIQESSPISIDENGNVQGLDSLFEYIDPIPGKQVDSEALYETVQNVVNAGVLQNEEIEAPYKEVPATIGIDDIKQEFKMISTATSYFNGNYSKKNRVFNINKAAEIINGYILEPGESFAFNSVLGPRTEKTGWKAAGAISEGKSVQETGGGICQVSSTAYNAVLTADLQIDERHPHSWPLSYIPAGQDATISTGGPDFVFTNNKDKPIVLIAFVDLNKNSLTVQFYGEPLPNNGEIKLVSKKTGTIPQPATQYTTDSSSTRSGRSGSKWETYKEYYENGELVDTKFDHNSSYRAISSISMKRAPKPAAVVAERVPVEGAVTEKAPEQAPQAEVAPKVEKQPESAVEIEDTIPIEIE